METETSRVAKLLAEQNAEIDRLRQQNAELRRVNKFLNHKLSEAIREFHKLDIPKATGGE